MSFPSGISREKPCLRSYGRPRILVVDQQRSLCSGIFAEKVESDGTRLEVTLLEAPWRNGKTERAGKDWKEDYHETTQDGPEAHTWTDFEEDCDAVNQAKASKINDSGYNAYQRVFGRNPPQMEDAILECGGADLGVVSKQQTREVAQERSMTASPAPRYETLQGPSACWTTPLVLATGSKCSQETTKCFLAPRRGHQVCPISSATVFTTMTRRRMNTSRNKRETWENDYSMKATFRTTYENITGQDELPMDSPPAPGENTATETPGPNGEGRMDVDLEARRRMRGKSRLINLEQPTVSPVNASTDTTRQEADGDHDDKRRRIDEPGSPVSTVFFHFMLSWCQTYETQSPALVSDRAAAGTDPVLTGLQPV